MSQAVACRQSSHECPESSQEETDGKRVLGFVFRSGEAAGPGQGDGGSDGYGDGTADGPG